MTQPSLEDRLSKLERTVVELVGKQETLKHKAEWRSTIGMFAGDPVVREIQEEGRRIREAERPSDALLLSANLHALHQVPDPRAENWLG